MNPRRVGKCTMKSDDLSLSLHSLRFCLSTPPLAVSHPSHVSSTSFLSFSLSSLSSPSLCQVPKTTYLTSFGLLVVVSYFVLAAIIAEIIFVHYLTTLVSQRGRGELVWSWTAGQQWTSRIHTLCNAITLPMLRCRWCLKFPLY